MTAMDIKDVIEHLPHRFPFLLIDRVLEIVPNQSLTALKNVSVGEPWFTGHFPEAPVMPGVLILEFMAQAAAILAYKTTNSTPDGESLFYLAGIDNAKFKQVVQPGDQLIAKVEFTKQKKSIWKISGTAMVDDKIVCSADITSAYKEINR